LGAPSITFIGDENSGLFRKSGGSVGFVSDATEIANFDSNGITISSGNLIIPDSIIHNGDTNTKIRFPAADTVTIETAGSERLRVDSSGNVGIGTTGPARNLEVKGASGDPVHFKLEGDPSDYARIMFADGTDDNIGEIRYNFGSDFMSFTANATERMRIASDGLVTIGDSVNGSGASSATVGEGELVVGSLTGGLITACDLGSGERLRIRGGGGITSVGSTTNHNLIFHTNGSSNERMRIDTSGRVLINKTTNRDQYFQGTLSGNLQVEGTDNATRLTQFIHNTNAASQHILIIGKSRGTSVGSYTVVQDNDYLGSLSFQGADGDAMVEGARVESRVTGTPSDQTMPAALIFSTNNGSSAIAERMRLDKDGQLLIGTTTSAGQLTVDSGTANTCATFKSTDAGANINLTDNSARSTIEQNGTDLKIISDTDAGDADSTIKFQVDSSTKMTILSSGKVGIGTQSPEEELTIESGNPCVRLNDTGGAHHRIVSSGDNLFLEGDTGDEVSNAFIGFRVSGNTERMRLSAQGTLSIGTTNNSVASANVQGISLDGANGYLAANRTSNESFGFGRSNNGQVGRFFNGGTNVGNITVASSTTAYNTSMSDRSKKKNFEDWTEDTLKIFKNLNPQKFNFITENDSEEKTKGFIAQDLVDSFPEAYPVDDKDGKYWFNPSGMVVYLMKAIQELEAKVAALEAT